MADAVVAEIAARGLADDGRFAEGFARSRVERGYGPLRVAQELRQRGVDDALAREVLAAYQGEWPERMETARARRFGDAPRDRGERLRQARFLEQRGFPRELIRAWVERRAEA